MAILEDTMDLWDDFPLQLKGVPLADISKGELQSKLTKKLLELPVKYSSSKTSDTVASSFSNSLLEREENKLGVVGSETSMVGSTLKTAKLYDCEDFHSFLAREGGIDQDRLSRLVDDMSPTPDEDFVSFIARSNGIKDEQMISRLRQTLKLEPVIQFQSDVSGVAVKVEQDLDLKVAEDEDAVTFFVRAGSWQSSSAISEELASVGLDEFVNEDAESFFRRTESSSEYELDEDYADASQYSNPAIVTLVASNGREDELLMQLG